MSDENQLVPATPDNIATEIATIEQSMRDRQSGAIQRVVPPRGEVGHGEDGMRGHDRSFRNG